MGENRRRMPGNRGNHRRAAAYAPQPNDEYDADQHDGNDRTGNGASPRRNDAPTAAPRHARPRPEQGLAPVVGTVARRHTIGTRFRARSATPIVLPPTGDVNGPRPGHPLTFPASSQRDQSHAIT